MNVIARLEFELAYYDPAPIALTITPWGHSPGNMEYSLITIILWSTLTGVVVAPNRVLSMAQIGLFDYLNCIQTIDLC